jgi:hypothetical protein
MALFNVSFTKADPTVTAALARIEKKLDAVLGLENTELMKLADLKTQVEKNTAIEESAVTLIKGIAAQLAAAKDDPAAIQALADELAASGADLSAAITANTPAAPAAA